MNWHKKVGLNRQSMTCHDMISFFNDDLLPTYQQMSQDKTTSQCESTSLSSDNTDTENRKRQDSNLCSSIMIKNPEISSNYLNSHTVNSTEKITSKVHHPDIIPNLVCSNTYTSLVVDEESDFEKKCEKYIRHGTYKETDFRNMRQPNLVLNNFPENDKAVLKYIVCWYRKGREKSHYSFRQYSKQN